MTTVQGWMVCLQCHAPATRLFDSRATLPLCDKYECERKTIDEINEQLIDAAEASKEQ